MPSFCFPCGPAAAKSHFDADVELLPSTAVGEANPAQGSKDLEKPTGGEYAGESAKQFLKVLEAVAAEIPVPGLSTAVQLATKLIDACDESHATLERAQELKLRIKTLVTLLVDELKGKKQEEIQEKLKKDVLALERDLTYIQAKLNEIASQHALLVVFFRGLNEDKVNQCVGRLNNSMERFNLAREISHTNLLDRLEKQIIEFHTDQQKTLKDIQTDIKIVKVDIGTALAILQGDSSSSQSRSRTGVPANLDIFYGRDSLVNELAHILTDTTEGRKHRHVCLLGPGGMGKTATALATMAHSDVQTCFSDQNRVWIPCVKATSISLFLDTLYQSLGITRNTGNARNDILTELKASQPLILLLDNFESPWNIDGGRSEVENILRDLDHISHVILFITMRSSASPCEGILWHSTDLRAVDADAAHQIYSHIYPKGSEDPNLGELLDLIGHMPLAVTMMAAMAKITKLTVDKLIVEYQHLGTSMLGQGSDAAHNMDICIGLSVNSPPMEKHPEALDLLAILTVLPVGTTYDKLSSTWAYMLPNLVGALQVLSEVSLVEQDESLYFVLPVIRSYILHPSHFPGKIQISMIQSACDFLAQHKSSPGDKLYKENTAILLAEEGNLEAILLQTTVTTPVVIDALLTLANHQKATRPRTDVIEHALKLVHTMPDSTTLLGPLLFCYGDILFGLTCYNDAIQQHTLARQNFLSVGKKVQAAKCLLQIVDIYTFTGENSYKVQKELIEDAKSEFESINNTHGVAICLYYLGVVCWQFDKDSEAEDFFTCAKAMLTDLQEPLYLAHCFKNLGVLYFDAGRYIEAQPVSISAIEKYQQIGYYNTSTQRTLSRLFVLQNNYNGALQLLLQALEKSKSNGNLFDIARTLQTMGHCWAKMGRKIDAHQAFEESQKYFSSLNTTVDKSSMLLCSFFIKRLENPLLIPTVQEQKQWLADFAEDEEEIKGLVGPTYKLDFGEDNEDISAVV